MLSPRSHIRGWPAAGCALLLAGAALAAVGGCGDTSFEVFGEEEVSFSVYGYLDAAASQQAVRVDPLQDRLVPTEAESLNVRVTSENLETGATVEWRDEVVSVGLAETPVHNFTTAAAIEPGATYRFTVESQGDGVTARAEVALPPAFPEPAVVDEPDLRDAPGDEPPTRIFVRGVEQIGGVQAVYDYVSCIEDACIQQQRVFPHLADTTRTGPESWTIEIDWDADIPVNPVATLASFDGFRVRIASVSEDWPEEAGPIPGPNDPPLPQPPGGGESNVEGGLGFLGGAYVRAFDVPISQ